MSNLECPFCKPDKKCNNKHCPYSKIYEGYRIVDLRGQKFGKLTPLKYGKYEKWDRNVWKCQCDCGNITYTHHNLLIKGRTKSCGCIRSNLRKEYNKRRYKQTALNKYYSSYRTKAKSRGKNFNLTIEQFEEITSKDCYYCGEKPNKLITTKYSEYKCNGVDRVNNDIGYKYENCVPCCSFCNQSKMDRTVEEFLENVKKIYLKMIKEDNANN